MQPSASFPAAAARVFVLLVSIVWRGYAGVGGRGPMPWPPGQRGANCLQLVYLSLRLALAPKTKLKEFAPGATVSRLMPTRLQRVAFRLGALACAPCPSLAGALCRRGACMQAWGAALALS